MPQLSETCRHLHLERLVYYFADHYARDERYQKCPISKCSFRCLSSAGSQHARTLPPMSEWWLGAPVSITGMHHSGTSTVAELLHRCGLYLGREDQLFASGSDNPDEYWEHKGFRAINERILRTYGGGWDLPPALPAGWHEDDQLLPLRS